jgi:acetyl esterase/lipase
MEGVPLPRALPVYQRGFHSLLRWAIDLAFSTFGFGWTFTGGRPLFAMPLVVAAIPYYLLQPQLSATHAAGVRASMSPGLAKLGCTFLSDNPVTKWCMMQCLPRMALKESFRLSSPNLWLGATHPCNVQRSSSPIPSFPVTLFCCNRSVRGKVCVRQSPCGASDATSSSSDDADIAGDDDAGSLPTSSPAPSPAPSLAPVSTGRLVDGPPNVILYCHGGGFFANLLSMDLRLLGQIAWATQALVVVPEYVLAPEHPFPTALDQMEAVYCWIVKGGLGFKPEQVILVGESAGGNLLAALCLRLLVSNERTASASPAPNAAIQSFSGTPADEDGLPMPKGLTLAYPTLNLAFSSSPSRALCLSDPLLGWGVMRMAVKAYLGDREC